MQKLLILENDVNIDFEKYHRIVGSFKSMWENKYEENEVTVFNNLSSKSTNEIAAAFINTNDIAFQTSFVKGSDSQTIAFAKLLAKIPESKNIYIGYYQLKEQLLRLISDEDIYAIKHHNIFKIGHDWESCEKLNFYEIEKRVGAEIEKSKNYKEQATKRTTGLKVKVLGCTAKGGAFTNLPIGEIVDVLDMSDEDPRQDRGVWIQGNGEPIKLVNDCGFQEYELVVEDVTNETDFINTVLSTVNITPKNVKKEDLEHIEYIIKNRKTLQGNLGNEICDTLNIPRRGNRQQLNKLLENAI